VASVIRLDRFREHYSEDKDLKSRFAEKDTDSGGTSAAVIAPVQEVLETIGGRSFNGGQYRTHRLSDVADWNTTIATAWTETAGEVCCFGYDWLGRQFGLYRGSTVLQFSAGALEMVEIPGDLDAFHNEVLVDMAEPALAVDFYKAWLASGGAIPRPDECVGYKRPLFLGGSDWIDNLELIDLDVYWTVCAPVIARARIVGVGGHIGKLVIDD
jgi:hypothetical protein